MLFTEQYTETFKVPMFFYIPAEYEEKSEELNKQIKDLREKIKEFGGEIAPQHECFTY